jgi:hypothetical protein
LGGYAATTAWAGGVLGDLFNRASSIDVRDARADYRAVYVVNTGTTATAVRAYLTPRTAGAAATAIGPDPRPVTFVDSIAPQGVEISTAYAPPAGVAFSAPGAYSGGVDLGDLPPSAGRTVWVRRTPEGTAGAAFDECDVVVEDDSGNALVRTVYWETEPYADRSRPLDPPSFVPTPSPFRQVQVDFVTAGGARVTWVLDHTLTDAGPYVFQLQYSHGGADNSDDWVDVGPPALDPLYLLDDTQRIWSISPDLHYRVILTTGVRSYVSPSAHIFGTLRQRDWLTVQELVRKEELHLRGFAGTMGWLLKARRYGPRCSCVDPDSGEVGNSSDPVCYGTGWVGGYHPPVPFYFANLDNVRSRARVAYSEGRGTVKDENTAGRMIAHLPITARDAYALAGSDERYFVAEVNELVSFSSTPVVYQVALRMVPRSSVLYTFPIVRPAITPPDWKQTTTIVV